MALLTQPVQVQSSFPQIAQQYAASKERERKMADAEANRIKAEQERAEAQRRKTAAERGELISGVSGLNAYPSLAGVGQQIYQDYLSAEDAGNVEEAETLKATLEKFMNGASAFVKSEQNNFNRIMTDPEVASQYNNSPEEISNVYDQRIRTPYQLKREGTSYTAVAPDGSEFDLFAMPELRGESFVSALNPKSIIPDYVNAINFGAQHANAFLNRNDVTNQMGRIVNPARLTELLDDEFDFKLTQSPEFINGVIYDYQKARGEMDSYDKEKINRLKQNEKFLTSVREDYINTAAQSIKAYERVKLNEMPKDKKEEIINDIVINKYADGKLAADFSPEGKSVKYNRIVDGQSLMANVVRISPSTAGVTVFDTVPVDANGNPTDDSSKAVKWGAVPREVRRGSDEWNNLSTYFGGEKYLLKLIRKLDPDVKM